MTFAAVTKILKVCTAAVILNYSSKREKRKLIYFSERKNNQGRLTVIMAVVFAVCVVLCMFFFPQGIVGY